MKPPYDDYSKLTLDELEKLASGLVDPSVQVFDLEGIKGFDPSDVLNADILLCSESNRSRETLDLILGLLDLDKDVVVEPLINEIGFSPKRLVENGENPLRAIRENFVRSLNIEDSGSEQNEDIKKRIKTFNDRYKGKKVFGVSHGFFLGFWKKLDMKSENPNTLDRIDYLEMLNFGSKN